MKLREWLSELKYELVQGSLDLEVGEVVYDSRKAAPECVFVCMRGANVDSHRFIPDVIKKGCQVIVCEEKPEVPEDVTVLLVEGATEYCALPEFFRRISFSLPGHGVEIINCEGKSSISLYARLFRAYGYHVYCLFDGDEKGPENSAMFRGICHEEEWVTQGDACVIRDTYAYFGKDYETYFRSVIPDWENLERHLADLYRIPTKPGIARGIAIHCKSVPDFFPRLAEKLEKLRKQETGIAPQQGRVSG